MAIQSFYSVRQGFLVVCKLALSFRKCNWDLRDYPIVIRTQNTDNDLGFSATRFVQHRYLARIVKWWQLVGSGDTPEDAMRDLATNFESAKAQRQREGKPLPRPGIDALIEFAAQERVNAHPELADDFVRRVLGLDWAWISNGSSLLDFHTAETNDALYAKIGEVYGVDVSDIENGNLAEILDRIAASGS